MRPVFLKFFLLLIIAAAGLSADAQTCTGSLGDPIQTETFGSGTVNPGPALLQGQTNYIYSGDLCPNDGDYSIVNATSGCFMDSWISVPNDHTGNPGGYFMLINASNAPGIFYTRTFDGLCPNTTYEFAAYILNVNYPSTCGGNPIRPNITFSIESNGAVIKPYPTGDVQPTGAVNWVQYGTFFTTPADVSSVTVKMTNNAPGGCGNDLALDDITFRACGPVIQAGFNNVSSTADQPLCEGDAANFTLKASIQPGVYAQPAQQWQQNINGAGWQDIPGETNTTLDRVFANAQPGAYQYRLGVADGANIVSLNCRVYSTPLTVNVYPKPVVGGIAPAASVCEDEVLQLTASGGTSYKWTGPNNFQSSSNPLIINNAGTADAGTYTVTAYSQYCESAPVSTIVTVNPKVTATAGGGTTICEGAGTQLTASGGTSYLWSPGKTLSDSTIYNPIASPTDTTTYTVTVTNNYGCTDTKTVTVNVLKKPVADAGPDKVIFEGQSVKLNGSQKYGDTFSWTPTTGLSDPNSLTPVASPDDDITYTLHVTSSSVNCGEGTSNVFVKVYKKITIPNTFSPNNDGINDTWNIEALITYPQSVLTIFNRYGLQLFRSVGYTKPWNGRYNGKPVPEGTYYYILDLKNNTPKISGSVLVVR